MASASLGVPAASSVVSTPQVALRGHQLGYRPKTNSYDAWDVPMWEQYIRDLAIFGTNAIELIPPRTDDAADSPHFPLPQMDMMVEMSRIADEYGLDVWIWYPGARQGLRRPEAGRVRAQGVGRGLLEAAAHRRDLRARRRSRAHAAEAPDGAAREADRQPAQVPSESADVGLAAGLHQGVDGRVLRHPRDRAGVADGHRVRPAGPRQPAGAARERAEALPDPPLSRHHPQPPQPVSRAGLGRRARADLAARADQPAPGGRGGDLPRAAAVRRPASSPTRRAATTT